MFVSSTLGRDHLSRDRSQQVHGRVSGRTRCVPVILGLREKRGEVLKTSEKTKNPHVGSRGNFFFLCIGRPSSPIPHHTAHDLFLAWAAHRLNDPSRFFVLLASKAPKRYMQVGPRCMPLIACPQSERVTIDLRRPTQAAVYPSSLTVAEAKVGSSVVTDLGTVSDSFPPLIDSKLM